mmetsp:Transcript_20883/g.25156  ORF Transcript_20883/g.25156 Transcript_20883/m.25156 type:complete len:136 (-) Transcript_20883:57-464(-)
MGWFGGSDSDSSSSGGSTHEADFTSSDESSSFSSAASSSLGGGGAMAGGGGGAGAELQQFSLALRQQLLVQQAVSKMSDIAFEKCVTGKPGDALSGKEAACIHASTNKWLDTNEFMMGRLAKKQQQAASATPQFS